MNRNVIIRNEKDSDCEIVEAITRKAFYTMRLSGCNESFLAYVLNVHKNFSLKEMNFIIEVDGQIVGSIMYTKSRLVDEAGNEKDIISIGSFCVLPEHQRRGYGRMLMEHSFEKAILLGYDVIVVLGNPVNYIRHGFANCSKHNISIKDGSYPSYMMAKELKPNALAGKKWIYFERPSANTDKK